MMEGYKKSNRALESTIASLKINQKKLKMEINTLSVVSASLRLTIEELRKKEGEASEALDTMLKLYDKRCNLGLWQRLQKKVYNLCV